jgi:intein-encoded DNA endonuclease-like protein
MYVITLFGCIRKVEVEPGRKCFNIDARLYLVLRYCNNNLNPANPIKAIKVYPDQAKSTLTRTALLANDALASK